MSAEDKGMRGPRLGSEVANNQVWRETIEKELKHQRLRTKFTVNPNTLFIIPDKPGQTSWTRKYNKTLSATPADDDADSSDTMVQDEDAKELEKAIHLAEQAPKEKNPWPLTSAQELGWDTEPVMPVSPAVRRLRVTPTTHFVWYAQGSRHWYAGRVLSDVTRYSDAYVAAQGQSPFKTKSTTS